jgi:hypothetical protein
MSKKDNKQSSTEQKPTVVPQKPQFGNFSHLRNGFKPNNNFGNNRGGFNPTIFKGPQHKG